MRDCTKSISFAIKKRTQLLVLTGVSSATVNSTESAMHSFQLNVLVDADTFYKIREIKKRKKNSDV